MYRLKLLPNWKFEVLSTEWYLSGCMWTFLYIYTYQDKKIFTNYFKNSTLYFNNHAKTDYSLNNYLSEVHLYHST
jgi:hypothetical protein